MSGSSASVSAAPVIREALSVDVPEADLRSPQGGGQPQPHPHPPPTPGGCWKCRNSGKALERNRSGSTYRTLTRGTDSKTHRTAIRPCGAYIVSKKYSFVPLA